MLVSKLRLRRDALVCTLFCALLFLSNTTSAYNKVVVIPMAGDAAPAHPLVEPFTNSIGMRFNKLPAGTFTMGSPVGEPGRGGPNEVQHQVSLSKGFQMQVTEVTNGQWNAVIVDSFLGSNPSTSHTPGTDFLTYPVETVSWFDAVFFANRLSVDEGSKPSTLLVLVHRPD